MNTMLSVQPPKDIAVSEKKMKRAVSFHNLVDCHEIDSSEIDKDATWYSTQEYVHFQYDVFNTVHMQSVGTQKGKADEDFCLRGLVSGFNGQISD